MFTRESGSARLVNFSSLIETERLLKVTDSHVYCEFGSIWETVQHIESLLVQTTK